MLDTIILNLPIEKTRIDRPELFGPHGSSIIDGTSRDPLQKAVLNPKKGESYRPRLTLLSNYSNPCLRVEFSIPKLLYGNNFEELVEGDLEKVITRFSESIAPWGIRLDPWNIRDANVTGFHVGKNIVFNDHTLASSIIRLFSRADYTKRMDLGQTDYGNGGSLFRLHSKAFQVVMYDKVQDLKATEARSIDKSHSREHNLQFQLFNDIRTKKQEPIEVIRLELRFLHKSRMQKVFGELGLERKFTLRALFKSNVWHALLKKYWQDMYSNLGPVLMSEITIEEQFELIMRNPEISPKNCLALMGLMQLKKGDGRAIRDVYETYATSRTWRDHMKLFGALDVKQIRHNPLKEFDRQIHEMKSWRKFDLPYTCHALLG